MKKVALLFRLEVKPGKEKDVAGFLHSGLSVIKNEPYAPTRYGIQLDSSASAAFDTFPPEAGRKAHLQGGAAMALKANSSRLTAV